MNDLSLPQELLCTVAQLRDRKAEFAECVSVLDVKYADLATRQRTIKAMQQEAEQASKLAAQGIRDIVGLPNKSAREAKRRELEMFDLIKESNLILDEETTITLLEHMELISVRNKLVHDMHLAECIMWDHCITSCMTKRQPIAESLALIHAYTNDPESMFLELARRHFPELGVFLGQTGIESIDGGRKFSPTKTSAFLHKLWSFLPEAPLLDADSDIGILCWPPAIIRHPYPINEHQPLKIKSYIESAKKHLAELKQRHQRYQG
ncbi:hypothetical protein LH425_08335 [Laribacter hongkongensis]|uniref:hypothetical protein n=1 Tax=Laribacter hongkongensis TaxID=168471 RepID=UPI001EFEA123|nr:hypothetical protein [Laribacter hongkongensis]MCG9065049.1 hypothetical protein [Laribacter hongkongensis]